jgi:uncharacterized coiled-coil DUF342 family protein
MRDDWTGAMTHQKDQEIERLRSENAVMRNTIVDLRSAINRLRVDLAETQMKLAQIHGISR